MEDIKKNIVLLGDGEVGKTSLIRKFVDDRFSDNYIATVGSKVTKKEVVLKTEEGNKNIVLMIWDIIGQHGFKQSQALSMRKADAALVVCDLTRKETLDNLHEYWIPQIVETRGISPLVFIGNKADLEDEAEFGIDDIRQSIKKSEKYGAEEDCFLSSAKTGANVENAFLSIASSIGERDFDFKSYRPVPMDVNHVSSQVDIIDQIIADFSEQSGGIEYATPVIKKQMENAGLDIKNPKYLAIIKFIDNLAIVEQQFKSQEEVRNNKIKRLNLFGFTKK